MKLTTEEVKGIFTEDTIFYTGNGEEKMKAFALTDDGFHAELISNEEGEETPYGDYYTYRWEELSLSREDIILPE